MRCKEKKRIRWHLNPLFFLPLIVLFFGAGVLEPLLFLTAALCHEFGHLVAIVCSGNRVEKIECGAFGAKMHLENPYCSYRKELLIFLAGPTANLLVGGLCIPLVQFCFCRESLFFIFCHALLALFNLMPIEGLDGARALRAALSLRGDDPDRVEERLQRLSSMTLLCFASLGLALQIRLGNPSLLVMAATLGAERLGQKKKATRCS